MKKLLFLLLCSILISCKKDPITPEKPQLITNELNINSPYTFFAEIDSKEVKYEDHQNDAWVGAGAGSHIDSIKKIYKSYFYKNTLSSDHHVSVLKGTLRSNDTIVTNEYFKNFFLPGEYDFSKYAANGFELNVFIDSTEWSTFYGDQTESKFIIEEIRAESFMNYYTVKIKASFYCNLYDGEGNKKILKNGKMVTYFMNM